MNKEQQEFILHLEKLNIEFSIDNNKIIINGNYVDLSSLTTLSENTVFNNGGGVYLNLLTTLPKSTIFNNGGAVYLSSLTTLPENMVFNNGGNVVLSSLATLPENTVFNNGGGVYLRSLTILPENMVFTNGGYICLKYVNKPINKSYIERFLKPDQDGYVIIYKRVSSEYKTQEDTPNETVWNIGSTLEHPAWNPGWEECGAGKFHACARPHWCDYFRSNKGDKYISIKVHVDDLFEWKKSLSYPQKIAFRKGFVIGEVNRMDVINA